MDEVSFALEEGKYLIPALYQPCERPFRLRRFQYVDFTTSYGDGLSDLVRSLVPLQNPLAAKSGAMATLETAAAHTAIYQHPTVVKEQKREGDGTDEPESLLEKTQHIQERARQGNLSAQVCLGVMYAFGLGVTQNESAAVELFRNGAEQGDAVAQLSLSYMYDDGRGVVKDRAVLIRYRRSEK
jgi:TPR repeat protein